MAGLKSYNTSKIRLRSALAALPARHTKDIQYRGPITLQLAKGIESIPFFEVRMELRPKDRLIYQPISAGDA